MTEVSVPGKLRSEKGAADASTQDHRVEGVARPDGAQGESSTGRTVQMRNQVHQGRFPS
jgi:hypothetical protein